MLKRSTLAILFFCAVCHAQLLDKIKNAAGGVVRPPTNSAPAAVPQAPPHSADAEKSEGTLESFLEMRAFAEGLYHQIEGSGPTRRSSDFKRRVDSEFEAYNKEDMRRAYEMNLSAKSEIRYVIEDRFRVYSGLYDNPVVQELVNRVGQSVISPDVSRLYTFKLVADPVPWAESLSTGTVWVSTGLVALTKSKAQLTYVLAHEAAHLYLEHHRERVLLHHGQEEYNRQLQENGESRQQRMTWISAGIGAAAGAIAGGVSGGGRQAVGLAALGATVGGLAGNAIAGLTNPRALQSIEWNRFEEDEADRLAFDWLLDMNADVSEVPAVFVALRDLGKRDPRTKLGFMGRTDRVRERLAAVQIRLQTEQAKPGWASRKLLASDRDFELLLAEVQRDNGIYAFHHDMLETARQNLQESVAVKTQDPTALYFYARVLSQTARTDQEREEADKYFRRASEADYRNQNYGTFLHRAIQKLTDAKASASDKAQSVDLLKQYVIGYHLSQAEAERSKSLNLPPHIESVYDYLSRAGELEYRFDDATIKRAQLAIESGTPLLQYRDAGSRRKATAVNQLTEGTKTSAPAPRKVTPAPVKQ